MRLRCLQTFSNQIHILFWCLNAFIGRGTHPVQWFQQIRHSEIISKWV